MNSKVTEYIENASQWQEEMQQLRALLLECQLKEELKWRVPCYTYNGTNILLIGNFKAYCTLSFFKGVLLNDAEQILVAPGENSQSVRMVKLTSAEEIVAMKATLKAYIYEAIEVEKAGIKVDFKESTDLTYCDEFKNKLEEMPALKTAFENLTPGRQRAYHLYFSGAKQAKTRESRIEKYMPRILDGIGINDCTCGLSKKQPYCDGSHKQLDESK